MKKISKYLSDNTVWPEALAAALLFLAISQDGAGVLIKEFNLHKYMWYILYFGGILLIARSFAHVPPTVLLTRNLLYLVLVAIALSSIIWSIDQTSTIKRIFHLSGQLLLVIGIGYTLHYIKFIKYTYFSLLTFIALAAFVAIINPDQGVTLHNGVNAWQGYTYNKNTLGMLASLCTMYSFFYFMLTKGKYQLTFTAAGAALSAIVLHKSQSATALVCLVLAGTYVVALYLLSKKLRWFSFFVLFTPVVMVIAVLVLFLIELRLSDITELVGRSDTLSNRTDIWENSWDLTLEKPLLGYGFGTIFYPYNDLAVYNHYEYFGVRHGDKPVIHAHNGFLTVSTQLGIPAAAIAIYIVLSVFVKNLYRFLKTLSVQNIVCSTLAFFVVVYNLAEDTLFRPQDTLWTIFLVFLIMPHVRDNVSVVSEKVSIQTIQYKAKNHRKKTRRKHHRANTVRG